MLFLYPIQFILRKKNQFPAIVPCVVSYYQKGESGQSPFDALRLTLFFIFLIKQLIV